MKKTNVGLGSKFSSFFNLKSIILILGFLLMLFSFFLKCFVEHNWFHLIGIVCGLAIYNFTVVDLHFPLALYKKLLNAKPDLDDLKELSPLEGR